MFDRTLPPFHPHPVPPTLQPASHPPRKPQVKTSTVYGSDRGNTVVPYGGAIDILRFSAGPREARHGGCPGDGAEYDQPRPDRRRPA